jgi:hypothetical protein
MTEPQSEVSAPKTIRPRDRDAILQSLRAGVVPRRGQQFIQVGRSEEVRALLRDLDRIADGGSAIRFVIGEFGSGKTFFLFLIRSIALEKGLVTAHADLTPDRRLQATGGQARSLYTELTANLATRTKPDGGAVASVVERFVTSALQEAREKGSGVDAILQERLASLSEMTGGYDFAEVVAAYWRGHDQGNDQLKSDAVRWLRGEFSTRTDARRALGVRTIVDDDNLYDQLKLFSRFTRLAGYGGLLVCLDELVNLYKLANTQARSGNYEQILRILNDSLQGTSVGLGFLLSGTPEFLMDTRRGLYSYEALRSRLAQNRFATEGRRDFTGPVIHLANLSPEELYVLLRNLRHVHAAGEPGRYLLPDEALVAFMEHCSKRVGEAYFRTPRSTIRAFLELLAVLEQNAGSSWRDLLGGVELASESNPDLEPVPDPVSEPIPETADVPGPQASPVAPETGEDDELASFRL